MELWRIKLNNHNAGAVKVKGGIVPDCTRLAAVNLIHRTHSMDSKNNEAGTPVYSDYHYLLKLAQTKMPYGKYAGRYLVDLPESYVVWFSQKGFPQGELGDMLRAVYEIKVNGLEYLLEPLKGI